MKTREKEKILRDAVLIFLVSGRYVTLAVKNKGIGAGKLNGYGGGIEEGETPKQAAIREVFQETSNGDIGGVDIEEKDLEKFAVMFFRNTTEEKITFVCKVHVYVTKKWTGTIVPSDEMSEPNLCLIDNLPFDRMMLADKYWVPIVLGGQKIFGKAVYGPRQESLKGDVQIQRISNIRDF